VYTTLSVLGNRREQSINRRTLVNFANPLRRIAPILLTIFGVLSACAYTGSDEGFYQPITRKLTWFSFVAGDDIRAGCAASQEDRYRLVYNGVYNEQVRAYDLVKSAEPGRYNMKIQVTGEADLSNLTTELSSPDLLKPWRPKVSSTNLPQRDFELFVRALNSSDFFDSPPPSEKLPSIGFYWVVSGCRAGKFYINAYLWPSKRYQGIVFEKLVNTWDFTDIPINPPRETTVFDVYGTNDEEEFRNHFTLEFGSDGLLRH